MAVPVLRAHPERNPQGLIDRVTPAGVLTGLHNFACSAGDGYPYEAPHVLGRDGNFYGSAANPNYGGNSIYRSTAAGIHKNLYILRGGNSISSPLAFGSDGNISGTVAWTETSTGPVLAL